MCAEVKNLFLRKRRLKPCMWNQTKRIQVYSVLGVEPMTHWEALDSQDLLGGLVFFFSWDGVV